MRETKIINNITFKAKIYSNNMGNIYNSNICFLGYSTVSLALKYSNSAYTNIQNCYFRYKNNH